MSTRIAWCDETVNVSTGCNRVAPECDNCYAISTAHRELRPEHKGLTVVRRADASRPGPDWNGVVHKHPERLLQPAKFPGRKRIFINSMSDVFHVNLGHEYIAAIHGMVAAFPQHTFIMLTKRVGQAVAFHDRMARSKRPAEDCVYAWYNALGETDVPRPYLSNEAATRVRHVQWPLPNLWLGVSVGTRDRTSWIEYLLGIPAALHCVSFEPLLEDIGDLGDLLPTAAEQKGDKPRHDRKGYLGWAILGGESGHKHTTRLCDVKWIRRLAEQLRFANVPTFIKQMGSRAYSYGESWPPFVGRYAPAILTLGDGKREVVARRLLDAAGSDPLEWPPQLQIQEHPRDR